VENGFIESFNRRLRDECLNVDWFPSLEEARRKLAACRLPEDIHYAGEALFRIAQTRGSLLSLWSDFQARKIGLGRPLAAENPVFVWYEKR
jgi:hypothetical protein